MSMRVGLGYDIHRLEAGTGLVLAGVQVSCPYRMVAHSDGDVVLHALCDALLGALGAGDIGEHFPDDDQANAGRDSTEFLRAVLALPVVREWRIANIDCNIIAQAPKLGALKAQMRLRLGRLLGLPSSRIGLKARTNENCDAIGAKKAIAAQVVVLLEPRLGPRPTTALSRRRRKGVEEHAGTARLAPAAGRARSHPLRAPRR